MGAHTDRLVVDCDLAGLPADLRTVAVVARLQLWAQRSGRDLSLRNADPALHELIELAGLAGVLRREGS